MNGTNVLSIPMYNNGFLTATGYRQGCGYNTKIYWGTEMLASSPDIISAMANAYYGIRLYSPKYHDWMTPQLRVEILEALKEMSLLIDPRHFTSRNEGLVKNITTLGMQWSLNNKVEVNIDPGISEPEKVVEDFRNAFFKSERLSVHIKLVSSFKGDYKDDLLEVTLTGDEKKGIHQLGIGESFLPIEEFGKEWIENARVNFTKCQLSSKRMETIIHKYEGVVVNKPDELTDPLKTGTGRPPSDFVLRGNGYKLEITGNVICLSGGDINIESPVLNIHNK